MVGSVTTTVVGTGVEVDVLELVVGAIVVEVVVEDVDDVVDVVGSIVVVVVVVVDGSVVVVVDVVVGSIVVVVVVDVVVVELVVVGGITPETLTPLPVRSAITTAGLAPADQSSAAAKLYVVPPVDDVPFLSSSKLTAARSARPRFKANDEEE